jgi:hypothetical protein
MQFAGGGFPSAFVDLPDGGDQNDQDLHQGYHHQLKLIMIKRYFLLLY